MNSPGFVPQKQSTTSVCIELTIIHIRIHRQERFQVLPPRKIKTNLQLLEFFKEHRPKAAMSVIDDETLSSHLKKLFKHSEFKSETQKNAIKNLLQGLLFSTEFAESK